MKVQRKFKLTPVYIFEETEILRNNLVHLCWDTFDNYSLCIPFVDTFVTLVRSSTSLHLYCKRIEILESKVRSPHSKYI